MLYAEYMANRTGVGRPYMRRNKTAGQNLRTALKILGKTWRKNVAHPSHVRNWHNWSECNLPTSATTIDGDMRNGVPEKRITRYALCLGVDPEVLCSPGADWVKLLHGEAMGPSRQIVYMAPGFAEKYALQGLEYNRPSYIKELFSLMGGVYRMNYLISGVELIHHCILWVHSIETHRMLIRGHFIMFGMENHFEGSMFRWHNNLHAHYLCENGTELGYILTADPLRHNIIRQRNPFWLRGTGITDRGLADNQPVSFTFHKQQLPVPENMTEEEFWQYECKKIHAKPFTSPGEPDYSHLYSAITTPEVLT